MSGAQSSLRAQVLRLLARRERTRAELEARLKAEGADPVELASILDEFSKCGWISDKRFIEQMTHSRRSRFGSARIRQELISKGVSEDLADTAMQELRQTDLEAARAIWRRKFRHAPANATERARQLRFLQSRGFSLDVALRVVREAGEGKSD